MVQVLPVDVFLLLFEDPIAFTVLLKERTVNLVDEYKEENKRMSQQDSPERNYPIWRNERTTSRGTNISEFVLKLSTYGYTNKRNLKASIGEIKASDVKVCKLT